MLPVEPLNELARLKSDPAIALIARSAFQPNDNPAFFSANYGTPRFEVHLDGKPFLAFDVHSTSEDRLDGYIITGQPSKTWLVGSREHGLMEQVLHQFFAIQQEQSLSPRASAALAYGFSQLCERMLSQTDPKYIRYFREFAETGNMMGLLAEDCLTPQCPVYHSLHARYADGAIIKFKPNPRDPLEKPEPKIVGGEAQIIPLRRKAQPAEGVLRES